MPAEGRLIGELQSAVRGREEALLGSLSGLAPEGVRVAKVDAAATLALADGPAAPSAPAAAPFAAATGDRVTDELNRRLLRVFDPQGIMLP
jgi:hypothetical protein